MAIVSMSYSGLATMIGKLIEEKEYKQVEVLPGDSVWKIAEKVSSDTNQNTNIIVEWILKENHLIDTTIQPGQVLIVPVEKNTLEGGIELAAES
jgi:LysM repeat protein